MATTSTHTYNDTTKHHTNIESLDHHLRSSPPRRPTAFTVPIKQRRTGPLSWLFGIFCAILWTAIITAGLAILIIYLIFRPKFPRLYIAGATLNAGHIDTDMGLFLNADLTLLANFTNPNHKVNIFFSYMELNIYFNNTIIATQGISGFSMRPKETMLRSVHMVTSEVMMRKADASRWQKEINQNKIGMEVEGSHGIREKHVESNTKSKNDEGSRKIREGRKTQEWLEEARKMVAQSPARKSTVSSGKLSGSPRFASGPPSPFIDRRDPLSRSARRHRSTEGFSGEILSRHNRNKSEIIAGAGKATPDRQWPQATTNPSEQRAIVALPPKLPTRPKSRFQDDPQSQPRWASAEPDGRNDLVLSPPRVLVETAHRRSISSSTCSLEKLGGDRGPLSSRGRRSVSRELESAGRHLDMVVDDDVMQINSFLRRQRTLIARIAGGKVSANAKATILLSASSAGSASSMVATIGYAWLLENMKSREGGGGVVVPVMNLKRRIMHKHRQVAWLFHYLGIDASALLFSDEVDLEGLIMSNQFSVLVTGQDVLNTDNEAGSLCTILTDSYCEHAYELLQTPNMKKLLLAGILLDTRNLDRSSKFHTHRDAEATQLLLVGSAPSLRQELFDQLIQDHRDKLFLEALRRNYGNLSNEDNDENGAPLEHKIPIRKSTPSSPQEAKPKHMQVLAPIQAPSPTPATPEPTPSSATRGKNKFFLAKWLKSLAAEPQVVLYIFGIGFEDLAIPDQTTDIYELPDKLTGRSGFLRKPNESMRLITTTIIGIVFGFFIGISFPTVNITKLHFPSSVLSYIEDKNSGITTQALLNHAWSSANSHKNDSNLESDDALKIYAPSNPRGAERLPPDIVVSGSDFYLRRLWGMPSEDLPMKQKYLVTFTVGYDQKNNINAAVKKFSENFTIVLFHYDGRTSEWDEFEWSKRAIHISVRRQTKWWYAKRFLHPDIVAAYEYIFIWDEDLGVEHFNAEEYIKLVKKHGLEISQPGLEPNKGLTWQMTKRRGDREVHKETEERPGWCSDPHLPPCAAFVEIMAPVFSRDAWRCVWHMIQNDLVHGWGLDFALRKCVEPAHEKIGVVDSQWIVHQVVPSLGNQGQAENGKAPWEGVRERCRKEWGMFQARMSEAEKAYYKEKGITPPNSTKV
ncbi:hypothetical protein J5N97_021980 [Dioscorea zingiberensis]|uniref:Uncharacterized protein n=4 Tax=Magnoliopsida TaxID=3398 RepID=A0A9D5C9I7_9LILI|nr:hypothetical protein J5N97_021980 [Dioscorea zingiberensis]